MKRGFWTTNDREIVSAATVIAWLDLAPHPEGGWFRQTWRSEPGDAGGALDRLSALRPRATAIYFLLDAHETSHWHAIDAAELWFWHAGAPLALSIAPDATSAPQAFLLGPEVLAGQQPQALVPPQHWQAAVPQGGWALVSCVVVPGFDFAGFTLASPGWAPGQPAT